MGAVRQLNLSGLQSPEPFLHLCVSGGLFRFRLGSRCTLQIYGLDSIVKQAIEIGELSLQEVAPEAFASSARSTTLGLRRWGSCAAVTGW